jgi:hypothetical protein
MKHVGTDVILQKLELDAELKAADLEKHQRLAVQAILHAETPSAT